MNPALELVKELSLRADGKFVPASASDFVGTGSTKTGAGSRSIALHVESVVNTAKACGNSPIKLLFNGQPGIGKTALAFYLQRLIGCDKWSTTKLNGTQLKVDLIEEISRQLQYSSLFGDYRMLHIDEANQIPTVAQVRFLTLMDDLPDGVAVVCTSNCKLKDFEPRFQTRFQAFEVIPPSNDEIVQLLSRFVPQPAAIQIATFACGNVRQALLDAKGILQTNPILAD